MSEPAGPPYHLHYWGGVQNDRWIERDLGITATDFWFDTKKERKEFAAKLRAVADAHGQIIAFAEHEGQQCKKRTVARMRMRLAAAKSANPAATLPSRSSARRSHPGAIALTSSPNLHGPASANTSEAFTSAGK